MPWHQCLEIRRTRVRASVHLIIFWHIQSRLVLWASLRNKARRAVEIIIFRDQMSNRHYVARPHKNGASLVPLVTVFAVMVSSVTFFVGANEYVLLIDQSAGTSGGCRDNGGGSGTMINRYDLISNGDCALACDSNSACVGYEWVTAVNPPRCEIHTGGLCYVAPAANAFCYIQIGRTDNPCPNISPPPPPPRCVPRVFHLNHFNF